MRTGGHGHRGDLKMPHYDVFRSQETAAGGEEDGFQAFSMETGVQTGASWVMKSTQKSDVRSCSTKASEISGTFKTGSGERQLC